MHILKIWLLGESDPLVVEFDNPAEATTLMREVAKGGVWLDNTTYYPLHQVRKMEIVEDDKTGREEFLMSKLTSAKVAELSAKRAAEEHSK